MAKVTEYVIIDQVGAISSSEIKTAYSRVYNRIAEVNLASKGVEGFVPPQVWTMKKVCQSMSPYAKEITSKMKAYARYNKHPKKVYLLCDEYDSNVKFVEKIWNDRDIDTEIISMHQKTLHITSEEASKYRRCASIWATALGWSFDAPLFRDEEAVRNTEDYIIGNKQFRRDLEDSNPYCKLTKVTQDDIKTQERFAEVVPEEECIKFFEFYKWLYKNNMLAESLAPDWKLCPHCGRPMNVRTIKMGYTDKVQCSHCDVWTTLDDYEEIIITEPPKHDYELGQIDDSYYESYTEDEF